MQPDIAVRDMAKRQPCKESDRDRRRRAALLDLGIEMINSRPYRPQTNGKLERFHGSIEAEIGRHESLPAYAAHCNEERLHWSLDIDRCETPPEAFAKRRATDAIMKGGPEWAERDTNGQAKQFPYTIHQSV